MINEQLMSSEKKKITDYKITCSDVERCYQINNICNVYAPLSLIQNFCSKGGFGCKVKEV